MGKLADILGAYNRIINEFSEIKTMLGRMEVRQCRNEKIKNINDAEFKVFSQWGEDGIIQYLVHCLEIPNKTFVEFGVQNYEESNTRFLLVNDNWRGLVLDGNGDFIKFIKRDPIYWKYNLKAEHLFITRDNINKALCNNGIEGDIGLLSVDIDGNDYWIWEAITAVAPRIVICEYNSIFGPQKKVTIPYREDFVRKDFHYSHLAYGASISALHHLAAKKGYSLVVGNKAGNNIFFVRDDVLAESSLKSCTVEEAYRESQFRESRDKEGNLTFLSIDKRRDEIDGIPVYDIESGKIVPFDSRAI